MRVKVKISRAALNSAARSEGVYQDLERRAESVRLVARGLAAPHYKTGDYADSFETTRIRVRGAAGVRLYNTSGHGLVLELGSRRHVIEPKTKKALAWPGAEHPVARVHHPGTPAYHFLRDALRAAAR